MADLKTIEDLTNAFGPSGFEEEVVKAVQKHCEGLNLRNDAMYNVYAMPDAKETVRCLCWMRIPMNAALWSRTWRITDFSVSSPWADS
ncbi:MAG: hypothetical protein ACLUD2_06465 [Clostridium sp.]